jgi:signal transduction histidine kinase
MAKELRQLDEMKNEFISNITHDIQSPLSTIKGYTNLLSKDAISENERNNYIQIINHEINQLSNLTKELLLLASLDRMENIVKMKPFQLSEQIKNLILNYQWRLNEKGIMISYTIPEVSYIGDAGLLYTVWDNLISNGIKYNKENGLLKIAVVENQDVIDITISDSGIGIADEHLERIFERFYRVDSARTRSIEGTGLGLSIVATIVKLHDGIIRVQSKIGEGTTMTVSLPKHNKSNAKIT